MLALGLQKCNTALMKNVPFEDDLHRRMKEAALNLGMTLQAVAAHAATAWLESRKPKKEK